jgi:hypothetical protein
VLSSTADREDVRRALMIVTACLTLAGVASQPMAARSTRPESEATKVRAVLLQEIALFNQSRWQTAWKAYSPRVRSRCSYAAFAAAMKPLRRATGRVTLRNVTIRVTGRRATAGYRIFASGKLVGGATKNNPDLFARVGGRWFDDFDADGLCPSGGAR